MFRTAALRTAASAVRAVARPVAIRRTAAAAAFAAPRAAAAPLRIQQSVMGVNDAANIKPTAHFANDLGLDSLDTVEVVMAIEEEFSIEIPDKDADSIHSIDKAVEYILNQPDAH
ncbi:hypothetical protein A9Z42_0071200 [Trichoderma parareesei]|uniref:Acyl carrier protein n=1 Tax=Trichoderma parareesei TaxID=858221 RepID=A0A2H2ZFU6_TRIPA|nr:hypothetical protein A9Z42_0071200 [Trichoderma parareesei]